MTDLEGELCAAKVGFLFLPEVVGFDDERHADLSREKLLQRLQQRFDQLPLGAAHVDDDGEASFTDVLAAADVIVRKPSEHQSCLFLIKHKPGSSSTIYQVYIYTHLLLSSLGLSVVMLPKIPRMHCASSMARETTDSVKRSIKASCSHKPGNSLGTGLQLLGRGGIITQNAKRDQSTQQEQEGGNNMLLHV